MSRCHHRNHVWKIVQRDEQPSAWDLCNERLTSIARAPDDFFVRPVVVTFACSICGTEKVERV